MRNKGTKKNKKPQSSQRKFNKYSFKTLCPLWLIYNLVKCQIFALLVLLIFAACKPRQETPQAEGAITDALGRRYTQNKYPGRIVSLSPAITEILFAIGAGEKVVGVTQYCDYPPEAKTRTQVGGFSGATVSMEQVRFLKPDLVILSADMHARIVSLLDELGIPSYAAEPRNFSQVYSTIELMGEITGFQDGAEKIIDEMKEKIAMVESIVSGRERPGVFWILNEDPLMTAGAETFVSEAIKLGGGRNIFEELREQWPMVSPEQVLLRKPDWVFFGNDADPAALLKERWQLIPAVREGRVLIVDADTLYRYGPRLADAVVSLAKVLHPDALPD